jgi:hypothetical protein
VVGAAFEYLRRSLHADEIGRPSPPARDQIKRRVRPHLPRYKADRLQGDAITGLGYSARPAEAPAIPDQITGTTANPVSMATRLISLDMTPVVRPRRLVRRAFVLARTIARVAMATYYSENGDGAVGINS